MAALLPAETVIAIDGAGIAASIAALRALLRQASARVEPRYRALVGLAEPLVAAALGVDFDALEQGALPGPWALAVVATEGRRVPILIVHTRGADWDLDAPRGAAVLEADGVLVIAAERAHCERYHAWRRTRGGSLAAKPGYLAARSARPLGAQLRIHVDVAALRQRGRQRLDPFGQFLLGPNVAAFESSTRFDATVDLTATGVSLRGRFDGQLGDRAERWLLSSPGRVRALPPTPATAFATLSFDRSASGFWARLDELLGEAAAVEARAFLSIADALLGGSLVDELVPALGEPMTLFAMTAHDDDEVSNPVVELPAFAVVAERRGAAAGSMLRRLFQNVVSVAKAEAVRKGQVTFRMRRGEGPGGVRMDIAEPDDWRGPGRAPTAAGLMPTLACTDGWIVFASTRAGAEDALEALSADGESTNARGDVLRIDPARGAHFLRANRKLLVLESMLKEGSSRRDARRKLDGIAALLGVLSAVVIEWSPVERGTEVVIGIEISDA